LELKLNLIKWPDTRLQEIADINISRVTPELFELSMNMIVLMTEFNGIGLAATQVGRKERIIVMKTTDIRIFFNPTILKKSSTKIQTEEGCLSFKQTVPVKRAKDITIRYMNELGKLKTSTFKGLDATVIQHEIDHLNGITLCDFGAYE
jgi:peptide deformylase